MTAAQAQDPTAVMGRRILAHLIDAVIYVGAFVGAFAAFAQKGGFRSAGVDDFRLEWVNDRMLVEVGDRLYFLEGQDFWITVAIAAGVSLFFMVLLEGLRGISIGKGLTGIRVVNSEGEPPGIGRALLRALLWIVDQIPTGFVLPLVGGVTALASTGHRRVGDMVAGTYVIKRAFVSQPVNPGGAVAPTSAARSWEPGAAAWQPPPTASPTADTTTVMGATPAAEAAPPPAETAPEPEPEAEAPAAYQPQWDPARQAYLQWDARNQQWLQFDDDAQEWRAIS